MCKGLKEIRDGKLYKELNYQNFEDYCKKEVGFNCNQAYKFISVIENFSKDFVYSRIQIGVIKLALLAKLNEPQREEIIQNVDLEITSVKELKEKISNLKTQNNRLMDKISEEKKKVQEAKTNEKQAWGKVSKLQNLST